MIVKQYARQIKTVADRQPVRLRDVSDMKKDDIIKLCQGPVKEFTEKFDKGKPLYAPQNPFDKSITPLDFQEGTKRIIKDWIDWSSNDSVGIPVAKNMSESALSRMYQTAYNILWFETSFRSSNFLDFGHFGIWRSPNTKWEGIEIHPYFKRWLQPAIKVSPGSGIRRYLWVIKDKYIEKKDPYFMFQIAIASIMCWLCRTIDRFKKTDEDLFEDLLFSAVCVWNPVYANDKFKENLRAY